MLGYSLKEISSIGIMMLLMVLFGLYFCVFSKEKLPRYYDENRISASKTVEILKKMLNTMTHTWNMQVSPLYRRIEANSSVASMEKMIAPLLQGLRQSPEYAYLQDNEDFLALLKEFEDVTK